MKFSNGLELEILTENNQFFGIGHVSFHGVLLRANTLPWTIYTESESDAGGVRFENFRLVEVRESDEGADFILASRGTWMPRIQEADSMGEARIKSRRLHSPEATFTWSFRPITEALYENEWQGLAMQIHYDCAEAPIHWLMEVATWEIDGNANGATLIQQDISTIGLEQVATKDNAFSTIEKFFTDGWGGAYPMDMLPRAAGAAICDFQSKNDIAICLFAEKPGMTRARLDKFAGEDVIHYLDRSYFPLGTKVQTPERRLLVYQTQQPLKRHERRNLWLDCFFEVRRRILAAYDFELEIPEPHTGAMLWDNELKELMTTWPDALERDLAEYAQLGYKQVFVHGVWDSVTSDPNPTIEGNICTPYSFAFAEMFGGPARMKKLNTEAVRHGLRLMQWFSFHLAKSSDVWRDHPDWVMREANGDPWDGDYHTLWSGRQRSGFGDWFRNQILAVNDDTGISGIFWDSYQNLGVTCVDWGSPDKAPQADEIFRMQGELQRKGFKQRVEIVTIFGVSQVATFGFADDKFRRRLWDDFVKGDQAFALIDNSPAFFTGPEGPLGPDRLSPDKYFWMVAHRSVPGLNGRPWTAETHEERMPGGVMSGAYARVNHLYNRFVERMHRPRLQQGGTHVVWHDTNGRPSVVWVFEDVEYFDGQLVHAETGEETNLLKAGAVYTYR